MMGRATKWLKGLFGMNKKKEISFHERGNKKTSSFGDSLRRLSSKGSNPTNTPPNISPVEVAWLRMMPPLVGDDMEQNHQVIAVAQAAIGAAEAAVKLVRLASLGRETMLNCSAQVLAAITIQTFFRGYLARKALRALKALVKVQALVRGFLVRNRNYAMFHRMKTLLRANEIVRAQKARGAILTNHQENCPPHFLPRISPEKFDNSRKNFKMACGNKRISAPFEPNLTSYDKCNKGFEIDLGKITSRSRRIKKCMNGFHAYSHATSSPPPPFGNPSTGSLPERRSIGGSYQYSTAQISPVFNNSCGTNAPSHQARSEGGDVYFQNENENYPNYMVNTQSFDAKMRSQSVPKQRGDDEFSGSKNRLSLHDLIMESKSGQNYGTRMQMPCSQAQEGSINLKNNVMAKIGRSSSFDN